MRKSMVVVIDFDVDEGCDYCGQDEVSNYLQLKLDESEGRMQKMNDPQYGASYWLKNLTVYENLRDFQKDLAEGVHDKRFPNDVEDSQRLSTARAGTGDGASGQTADERRDQNPVSDADAS